MDVEKVSKMAEKYTAVWCSGDPEKVAGHFDEAGYNRQIEEGGEFILWYHCGCAFTN